MIQSQFGITSHHFSYLKKNPTKKCCKNLNYMHCFNIIEIEILIIFSLCRLYERICLCHKKFQVNLRCGLIITNNIYIYILLNEKRLIKHQICIHIHIHIQNHIQEYIWFLKEQVYKTLLHKTKKLCLEVQIKKLVSLKVREYIPFIHLFQIHTHQYAIYTKQCGCINFIG